MEGHQRNLMVPAFIYLFHPIRVMVLGLTHTVRTELRNALRLASSGCHPTNFSNRPVQASPFIHSQENKNKQPKRMLQSMCCQTDRLEGLRVCFETIGSRVPRTDPEAPKSLTKRTVGSERVCRGSTHTSCEKPRHSKLN